MQVSFHTFRCVALGAVESNNPFCFALPVLPISAVMADCMNNPYFSSSSINLVKEKNVRWAPTPGTLVYIRFRVRTSLGPAEASRVSPCKPH